MSLHLRTGLKASACAVALSVAVSAGAQTVPEPATAGPAAATATASSQGQSPVQEPVTDGGLADIVVTAQRRSENLQRVGIAVSAVTGDTLVNAGISEPANLSRLVPALAIQPTGGPGVSIYVRGVGAQALNAFAENAVAFNFNGVYIARPTAPVGTFFDLERVEVVKGPQGTLYGRNATGGAVNVIPRAPTIGEINGEINLEYGNYDNKRGSAALNLPIGETMALRVAGQIVDRDPYLSDGYTDEVGQAARASLLFRPNQDFSATIVADYFHQGGKGIGSQLAPGAAFPAGQFPGYAAPTLEDRVGGADPASIAALTTFAGTRPRPPFCGINAVLSGCVAPPARDGYVDNHYYGVTAIVEGDMGFGTLTVQPAYRKSKTDFLSYFTGFRGKTDEDNDQISLEVRLTSKSSQAFRYVVGGFYFHEKQLAENFFTQGTLSTTRFNPRLETESKAVFGQATLDVNDRLRLIGGARYTKETKTQVTSIAAGGLPFAVLPPLGTPFRGNLDFSKVTWKAGAEWDAGERSLVYANVATGFKSGGFFVAAPSNNTFAPEELTAYTIGSKNRFLDNRLQFNVEAFYWDYKDQQISFVGGINSGTSFSPGGVTVNAGNARMYGAEIELVASVGAHGRFNTNVQYLDAQYDSLAFQAYSASGAPVRTGCAITGTSLANPGVNTQRFYGVDCAGKQTINSPRWTIDAGYEHTVPLGDYNVVLGAQGRMQASYFVQVDFLPEERQDAYFIGDASITLEPAGRAWSLTGYVNNIGNEPILAGATLRPVLDTVYVALRPPRTYGARLRYRF